MAPMIDESQQGSEAPFAAYQQMLCERLLSLLSELHPLLQADVKTALQQKGKLLAFLLPHSQAASRPDGSWSLAVLLIAQHISPTIDPLVASTVAVALECFICALDLLDDIEDEDQTPVVLALGAPRTLNVSTALLTLTQRALLSLATYRVSSSLILRLLEAFQQSALIAISGQHKDLLAEGQSVLDMTMEECIAIAAEKAGALFGLTCEIGVICTNTEKEAWQIFSALGESLGIAHQLDNDSHDLYHILQSESSQQYLETKIVSKSVKTDLTRQKKTLPVVLAARSRTNLQQQPSISDSERQASIADSLHEGIIATWGISLLYKERAGECLQKIEARQPVSHLLRLLLGFN